MNVTSESGNACPVCNNLHTRFAIKIKDHSVSSEFFEVYECPQCTLRFTRDAPDDLQIGRYYQSDNYISHSNTRRGLVNTLYHLVRSRTLKSKKNLLERNLKTRKGVHLDIGAGTGAFVQYMNLQGWDSTGIEPDSRAREMALEHHKTKLLPGEAFENFQSGKFDAISLWHVLEHVHDLFPYLEQIKKILKPGGLVFIAVPNYTSYDATKYGADWAAYDVPRHLYHFSPFAMQWLLKAAGLQLIEEVPMWWDSFYISLLSEKYKTGHSSILKGFVNGAVSDMKVISNKERCSSLIYVAGKA
jgi:2-polyprenyl-3-methyl-5-hydroxy-6-metoxy-1,4-benzoquinol methylase